MGIVERKRLFNGEDVTYEHYKGSHVKLRVAGLVISVYKPYGKKKYKDSDEYYIEPKIEISANATVLLNIQSKILIDKAIEAAISILNSEGDGLVIDCTSWKDNFYTEKVYKQPNNEKIKTVKPGINTIFRDKTRKKWLYLGYGYFYNYYKSLDGFKFKSKQSFGNIYVELGDNYNVSNSETMIMVYDYIGIDSIITERRAVEILGRLTGNLYDLVLGMKNGRQTVYRIVNLGKNEKINREQELRLEDKMNYSIADFSYLNNYVR